MKVTVGFEITPEAKAALDAALMEITSRIGDILVGCATFNCSEETDLSRLVQDSIREHEARKGE